MLRIKLSLLQIVFGFLDRTYLRTNTCKELVRDWCSVVEKRVTHRGPVETVGWIKSIRLACTRYMCGTPLSATPGFGVHLDKDGLPRDIALVELFRSRDPLRIRAGLTLLGVSRLIPGWKSPDLAPLIDPGVAQDSQFCESLAGIVKELGWKLVRPEWTDPHLTTKSGPNAQAMVGSVEDATLLTETQISYLRILGGDLVVEQIERIRQISPLAWLRAVGLKTRKGELVTPKGIQSRLSLVKDKETKCRIVAILDYWTQTVLKPLHDSEMKLLKSLKTDCTFNQGRFRSILPKQGPYHSLDLSAATDRMPAWAQEAVLAALISKEYAGAWRSLLCSRSYFAPWANGRSIVYGAGQPMGAYSSWATFALTHHVIVRLAAKRAGLPVTFSGYALLGDDIVIANDAVAKEYRAILASLGVSVSELKTHSSRNCYEFAKRWVLDGVEVTPAPLGSLFEACRFVKSVKGSPTLASKAIRHVSYYEVATWFRELESRWLPRSRTLVSRGLLASFFLALGRSSLSFRLADKAWKFFLLPSREDSRQMRKVKCDLLGLILSSGTLGCNHFSRSTTYVCTLLGMAKGHVLEEAIKRQHKQLVRFQLEFPKYLTLAPEGLDAQSLLSLLPPFAVARANVRHLQLEYDKARSLRTSDREQPWLYLDIRLFLDPFALFTARANKVVATTKATVLNHMGAIAKLVAKLRNTSLTPAPDATLQALVNQIGNFRGIAPPKRRPVRKGTGRSLPKDTSVRKGPSRPLRSKV